MGHLLVTAAWRRPAEMQSPKIELAEPPGGRYARATMKGYGQFCPVAKAAEIVAERWTPLVLRELLCGSHRFADLHRGVPLMSRALLAQRLRQLEDAGIIRSTPKTRGRGREYALTPAGGKLVRIIGQIQALDDELDGK